MLHGLPEPLSDRRDGMRPLPRRNGLRGSIRSRPDQQLGQAIDLLHHAVDLAVSWPPIGMSANVRVRRWRVGRRDSSSLPAISLVIMRRDRLE